MSDLKPATEPEASPQSTKEDLDRRKVELEIKDLERPFWKRPVYILAALPTMLAVVTLSVGLFNGYFSASLTKLENQKHDVESQIKEFEAKRDKLNLENEQLKTEKRLLETRITELQQTTEGQIVTLEKKRAELERNNNGLSLQNEKLKSKFDRMEKDFDKIYSYTTSLLIATNRLGEINAKFRLNNKEVEKPNSQDVNSPIKLSEEVITLTFTDRAQLTQLFEELPDNSALKRRIAELADILKRMKKEQKK